MGNINDLIQQYCPNGCKYVALSDLADIGTGTHNTQDAVDGGEYIFYVRSQQPLMLNTFDYDDESVITAGDGVGVGKVFHITHGKYALHQRAYRIHPKNTSELNTRYLYYYFSNAFYDYIMMSKYEGSVASIRLPMLKEFEIPVPPLPVQEEIVHILDTFTELEQELEQELELRKKQYEYYRDKMLSLEDYDGEVKIYKLSELVTRKITDGMHNLPKNILSSGYAPILSAVNIYDGELHVDTEKYVDEETYLQENKRTDVSVDDVLLTIVATLGRVTVVKNPMKVLLQRSVAVIRPNQEIIISDYLRFYLETYDIQYFIQKHAHGAAQKGFYVNQINDLKITIPTDIAEQKRIVDVLDKFSTLTSDISEGLPAEIKMRHQQYEYYRDKLLTFKRLENETA